MAKTVWHCGIAASLEGGIARPDGAVDDRPAADFPAPNLGFDGCLEAADAILMGRMAHEVVKRHGDRPHPGKPTTVMTARPMPDPPRGAETRSGDLAEVAAEPGRRGHRRVRIAGGGRIVRSMISTGRFGVLEMALTPAILGEGTPPFLPGIGRLNLRPAKREAKNQGRCTGIRARRPTRRDAGPGRHPRRRALASPDRDAVNSSGQRPDRALHSPPAGSGKVRW